jgi:hypothetical protein
MIPIRQGFSCRFQKCKCRNWDRHRDHRGKPAGGAALMALPSEALDCSNINGLPQDLGKVDFIDDPGVSGASPKLSPLGRLASATAKTLYDAINRAQSPDQLDHLAKMMWSIYSEGGVTECDATFLSESIDRRTAGAQ